MLGRAKERNEKRRKRRQGTAFFLGSFGFQALVNYLTADGLNISKHKVLEVRIET